jgi:hypothetical protein
MIIAFPDNKFHAYSKAISEMLQRGWTSKGELDSNIGHWVHLGQILPTVHHFLIRLCFLKQWSENMRQIKIDKQCTQDLQSLLFVLGKCHQDIDLNLIAFQQPTHVYRSDSCPARLGGYSHKGFVWQFYLTDELKFHASNNLLERPAAIITMWIDFIAGHLKKGDCALSMTNNTTSEGWLRKSNFIEDGKDPIQATI